ncbi:MAG: hypothetical protein FWE90_04570 [Defluviitaleaceae bacterium]|nr:hypothetical protein [Defluviitaleaceae bacterium]
MQFPFIHINDSKSKPIALPVPYGERAAVYMDISGDHGVAARFIEAVQANPDSAWAFVSKMYVGGLDLNALRELLPGDAEDGACAYFCKWVNKATYGGDPKRFITRSLYVADPERNLRRLVHLRMIREPDKHGIWKICAVEQEDCPRGV